MTYPSVFARQRASYHRHVSLEATSRRRRRFVFLIMIGLGLALLLSGLSNPDAVSMVVGASDIVLGFASSFLRRSPTIASGGSSEALNARSAHRSKTRISEWPASEGPRCGGVMNLFRDDGDKELDALGPDNPLARWARYAPWGNKAIMRLRLVVGLAASFLSLGLGIFLIASGRHGGLLTTILGVGGIVLLPSLALLLRRQGKL